MRFAVLADIHGNLAAFQAVLSDIDSLEHKVDVIVCAGDLVGHAAHPNEVIALLKERDIQSVRGNYDEVAARLRTGSGKDYATEEDLAVDGAAIEWTRENLTAESLTYLEDLPTEARVQLTASGRTAVAARKNDERIREYRRSFFLGSLVGGMGATPNRRGPRSRRVNRILVVHGSPRDSVEYLYPGTSTSIFQSIALEAEVDVIIFGHVHSSYQRVVDGVAFIGVGSVGRPRGAPLAEYAVIEIAGEDIEVEFRSAGYNVEAEAADIEASGLPRQLATQLRRDANGDPALKQGL